MNKTIDRKPSLADKIESFGQAHGAVSGIIVGLLMFCVLALVFWFTLFSGISSSADFIYAQF